MRKALLVQIMQALQDLPRERPNYLFVEVMELLQHRSNGSSGYQFEENTEGIPYFLRPQIAYDILMRESLHDFDFALDGLNLDYIVGVSVSVSVSECECECECVTVSVSMSMSVRVWVWV